jgi:predicted DNA-binding transcriptional regulator YafY
MNRIDRLFAITVLLQARRKVRALDLARLFEVSERTIYRDMEALGQSGIPISSTPGEGYELAEDFYLPTVQLSSEEAKALFLGAEMLKAQASGTLLGQVESALAKIKDALPEQAALEAARLVEILRFFVQPGRLDLTNPHLLACQQAIHEKRVVWLRYHSYSNDEVSQREVEPEALHYNEGAWYLSGYCRLRREARSFRLSRIDALRLQAETFIPRLLVAAPASQIEARVRFAAEVVRWVRERQHYGFCGEEELPGGQDGVVMVYRVNDFRELRPWLLAWGGGAELLSPAEAREDIREELRGMLARMEAGNS